MRIQRAKRNRAGLPVFAAAAIALLLAAVAWGASPLDAAKDAGVVGERRNGYIGLVVKNPTADQKALVKDVNARRRAHYKKIADGSGATADQVAARAAQRLIREAKPGHYVQAAGGEWVRKP